jgi:uncharacterized protein YdhG (YjbR/CyaY superfamily)
MRGRPETTDEYLAPLTTDKPAAIEKIRKTIRSVVPEAVDRISYLPTVRLRGREI